MDDDNMTLLFDGRFKSTDKWIDTNHFSSSYPGYNSCNIRPDTLIVIPDIRFNYVGKFTLKSGDYCNSGTDRERTQLQYSSTNIGDGLQYNEIWISWSEMLDTSWQTQDINNWYAFTAISSFYYYADGGMHGEFATIFNTTSDTNNLNLVFRINRTLGPADYYYPFVHLEKGKWFDYMMHIKFAKDNTGFYEMYVRKSNELNYTLFKSEYNVITQMTIPSYPNSPIMSKFGIYRNLSPYIQTLYHSGIKIGTTQNDVYYEQYCPQPQCNFSIQQI